MTDAIHLRLARDGDLGFIVDSWRKSYVGGRGVEGMDRDVFFAEMKWHIERTLALHGAVSVVACSPGDDDTIAGWAVAAYTSGPLVLHYAFVRKELRGEGIGRQLVEECARITGSPMTDITFSHWSRWLRKAPRGLVFNPFEAA